MPLPFLPHCLRRQTRRVLLSDPRRLHFSSSIRTAFSSSGALRFFRGTKSQRAATCSARTRHPSRPDERSTPSACGRARPALPATRLSTKEQCAPWLLHPLDFFYPSRVLWLAGKRRGKPRVYDCFCFTCRRWEAKHVDKIVFPCLRCFVRAVNNGSANAFQLVRGYCHAVPGAADEYTFAFAAGDVTRHAQRVVRIIVVFNQPRIPLV